MPMIQVEAGLGGREGLDGEAAEPMGSGFGSFLGSALKNL